MNTKSSNYFLARTSTGKVHSVMRGSQNAAPCNSRNGGFRVSRIAADTARRVAPENFCGKCFPKGKPSDEEINAMCSL